MAYLASMGEAVLELMITLAQAAETDDVCASQLAAIAMDAADAGEGLVAQGMIQLPEVTVFAPCD